jgi:LysM repeat protein
MSPATPSVPTSGATWRTRALAVGAGVAAAMAVGGMSSPAHAGTDAEWERLAMCESSGRWDINTGNGYYGGLQFSKSSWDWVGGERYAAYPHQATKAEQIAMAERLLDRQHVSNAWPACSRKLGLTQAALQSGTPTPPGGASTTTPAPSGEATVTAAASGTHRVRSGDTLSRIANQYDVAGGWRSVWDANRDRVANPNVIRVGQVLRIPGGTTSAAPAPAPAAPAPAAPAPASTASSSGTYTVRAGDTLWEIARDQGVSGGWSSLYQANRDTVSNPNVIRVGQVLRLP